jgi:dTDP-4-dehydrorhamnose 3,5-epimerase-like enzyme
MIKGVQTKQLKIFNDDRGCFIEVLKADDPFFKEVKQTSYTETHPGVFFMI